MNYPTEIASADALEVGCAKISAMIYPNANAASSKIEIKDDRVDSFNIDSLFQKQFKLKTMNEWSYEKFEEKMGNKISYGVIVGDMQTGKTEVANHLAEKMGHRVINMPAIAEEVRKTLADDEGNLPEGDIAMDKIEAWITDMIRADPKARYVFDDYTHKDDDDFIAFVSKFGQPDYLLFLTSEKDTIKQRYMKKEGKEEFGDEDLELLKTNQSDVKAKKQKLQTKFEETALHIQENDKGVAELLHSISTKFAVKLILVNHEKKIPVDTVCANLALKYNMLYISVYQLIKEHVTKDTEWG